MISDPKKCRNAGSRIARSPILKRSMKMYKITELLNTVIPLSVSVSMFSEIGFIFLNVSHVLFDLFID